MKNDLLKTAIAAVFLGAAIAAGRWLVEELQSPVSDVRLWLSSQLDTLKGETE